jgi:hypothetical protein
MVFSQAKCSKGAFCLDDAGVAVFAKRMPGRLVQESRQPVRQTSSFPANQLGEIIEHSGVIKKGCMK